MNALETVDLEKRFGGIVPTNGVNLQVREGARHALIGPNGAGKTTLINLLTGVLKPSKGTVKLGGSDITNLKPHQRVARGITRTFQINQLFADLSPLESIALVIGEREKRGTHWWSTFGGDETIVREAASLAAQFGLADALNERTSSLPYGKQRQLEIALAIAGKPRVLLLDEPAAGVPEAERHEILETVAALPKDVTVLLIEHDMDIVFGFADRISVLVDGKLLVEGDPKEIQNDPRVRAVYLGEGADD
ncbi:MAG: ABC transporter ATP-binding protein [Xanthobacteraceae bacterium]|nr:ABC transporter ATP-binding protein [Xanthobacteraceae bacterium]MBX3534654.1 ABC transporter ATP-binding protein [Xanthobacteraceae bacterium]MCW5675192.1 ABC transporter ATP-binding protein [Xanthobacteraceae bacterium]MCW5676768.1 ABC transporter ATP-binding protein [Xanthobacteraceae bacterium]